MAKPNQNPMKKSKVSYLVAMLAVVVSLFCFGFGKKEKTAEEFMQIAAAGGNLVIDANGKSVEDLMKIAAVSRGSNRSLQLKNCGGFSTSDLIKIAAVGQGRVVMEF